MIAQLLLWGGEHRVKVRRFTSAPARYKTNRAAGDPGPCLFVTRSLEPGEPHRCLDCGIADEGGTYGPPGLEEVPLPDGDTYTAELANLWFCRRCSHLRWDHHVELQIRVPARRRRLRAFAVAASLGHRGHMNADLFRVAEEWLRNDTIPGPDLRLVEETP